MDNVTHALAGTLLASAAVAFVERRGGEPAPGLRGAATLVAIVAAEFPDLDVFYSGQILGMGKLGPLLHHRGHTHTMVFAVFAALVIWGVAMALRKSWRSPELRWPFLCLALAGTLSHIALDFSNNYGVHPFWPLDGGWYYGDSIFIIEPWIWIVAIPPLLFLIRNRGARVLLAIGLTLILLAAWRFDGVERGVAIMLTFAAIASVVIMRVANHKQRLLFGVVGWLGVESAFAVATMASRSAVQAATNLAMLRDVSRTPAIGNPLCVRALVVEHDGVTYRVTEATVSPFPALRSLASCIASSGASDGTVSITRPASHAIAWGREWSAPSADLMLLIRENCEIAHAMHFMRIPFWWRGANGAIRLSDLRYSESGSGFASIETVERRSDCRGGTPPWGRPRGDIFDDTVGRQ